MEGREVCEREEIYSYLKCKICDGYFENAKILTECFHSFCLVCISQSAECLTQENHFSIACEICNTITTTPSLSLLPSNSISDKLLLKFNPKNNQVKLLSNNNNNEQNEVLSSSQQYCDNQICKEENKKASLYCHKCGANYCEECWKVVHSFGVLQKHSPLPILQKNNSKYCSTHHKQMKIYCFTCDQLLCSLCWLDYHFNNNNNNNNISDNEIKNHLVMSIDKASEDIKKQLIKTSDQIILNRSFLDKKIYQNTKKREEINQSIDHMKKITPNFSGEIEKVKVDIEKLEIEKEIIEKKIKEDEENSTQIEISNRMIKDMIQSLPSILTVEKKYRDQIDHQISFVFETIYPFPLSQLENHLLDVKDAPYISILNEQSYKGGVNDFSLSNDGKKFIKIQWGYCGITVKKGISSGKYQWKILYENIDNSGWLFIGVQLNKPICSSPTSFNEKESFGVFIYSSNSGRYGGYYIEGKSFAAKERNLFVKKRRSIGSDR